MKEIKNVSVIGGGTMGNGIAHVFAMSGFEVTLVEAKQQFLDKALDAIEKNLDRMLSKQKISNDDKKATLQRIHSTLNTVEGVMKADLVVEAIPEQFDLKKMYFWK